MQAHRVIRPGDPEPAKTHAFRGDPRGLPVTMRRDLVRQDGTPQQLIQQELIHEEGGELNVAIDAEIMKKATEILKAHYPGHLWNVWASSFQGVMLISIPILMGPNHHFIIHFQVLNPYTVIYAGGEILERYGLRRGRFELGSFLDARAKHGIPNHAADTVPE